MIGFTDTTCALAKAGGSFDYVQRIGLILVTGRCARRIRSGLRHDAGRADLGYHGRPFSVARCVEIKGVRAERNTMADQSINFDTASTRARRSGRAKKLEAQLRGQVGKAIADYRMIEDRDRIMVCLSGGKDSYTLLDMLLSLQRRAPVEFELIAVNLDQKQPGFPQDVLPRYLSTLDVRFKIIEEDTYSTVTRVIQSGKTYCGLCSRLRRGILYRVASEIGATKIALGHHREDVIETLFLNMFFGARLKAMPPKLLSDDGRQIVIRPLVYCSERDIARYAAARRFPIIPCDLCGSQQNLKRRQIKAMLAQWERDDPGRSERLFRSLQNVTLSHLADPDEYDFQALRAACAQPEAVESA